jgi:hypothetical protein
VTETQSFSFRLELGALVRSSAIFEIRSSVARYGLDCSVLENRGWLESEYEITVSGNEPRLGEYREALRRWLRENTAA